MNKTARNVLVGVAVLLLVAVTGITTSALGQPTTHTVTLIQGPPALAEHPSVEAGKTGSTVYFEDPLTFSGVSGNVTTEERNDRTDVHTLVLTRQL